MEYKLWIDGRWVESKGGSMMPVENPATGQIIAEVVDAGLADVDLAVQAAKRAFYDGRWSRLVPSERSKAIWKLADLLEKRPPEFARLESENTGKPYAFVSLGGDLMFSVDNLRFFAGAPRDTHGSHAGEYWPGYTSLYRRDPVGVVGQIAPWNYRSDDGRMENWSGTGGGLHDRFQTRLGNAAHQLVVGRYHPGSRYPGWCR